MNAKQTSTSGLEHQLSSISMSERAHSAALHDAYIGELFADVVVWVCGKFNRPSVDVFATTSPKY